MKKLIFFILLATFASLTYTSHKVAPALEFDPITMSNEEQLERLNRYMAGTACICLYLEKQDADFFHSDTFPDAETNKWLITEAADHMSLKMESALKNLQNGLTSIDTLIERTKALQRQFLKILIKITGKTVTNKNCREVMRYNRGLFQGPKRAW